jgi:hypothetical protein
LVTINPAIAAAALRSAQARARSKGTKSMQLNLDPTLFEEQQAILVRELVQSIRVKLQEAGLSGSALEDLTLSIAFSVASAIDDTAAIEVDGTEVHPYLTFRTSDGELTHCGENSYTHEFVYEALQAMQDN